MSPVQPHADDLGLHPAIDRAIFLAHARGAIAGASILVTGATFSEAAAEARRVGLPVWLHLALVDAQPSSPPGAIPSLITRSGAFPSTFPRVAMAGLLRRLHSQDLKTEILAQVRGFREAGLADSEGLRLDGHQHLHILPVVLDALLDVAHALQIRSVRCPVLSPAERRVRSARSIMFQGLDWLSRRAIPRLRAHNIQAVPCWGTLHAGQLTVARARDVLASLPPTAEGQLICHPGADDAALAEVYPWAYQWETELATVLALADGE